MCGGGVTSRVAFFLSNNRRAMSFNPNRCKVPLNTCLISGLYQKKMLRSSHFSSAVRATAT